MFFFLPSPKNYLTSHLTHILNLIYFKEKIYIIKKNKSYVYLVGLNLSLSYVPLIFGLISF